MSKCPSERWNAYWSKSTLDMMDALAAERGITRKELVVVAVSLMQALAPPMHEAGGDLELALPAREAAEDLEPALPAQEVDRVKIVAPGTFKTRNFTMIGKRMD